MNGRHYSGLTNSNLNCKSFTTIEESGPSALKGVEDKRDIFDTTTSATFGDAKAHPIFSAASQHRPVGLLRVIGREIGTFWPWGAI